MTPSISLRLPQGDLDSLVVIRKGTMGHNLVNQGDDK